MISAAAASGDAAVCCELPGGSIAFILSDGMGKGDRAAEAVSYTHLGKQMVEAVRKLIPEAEITAVGTNPMATTCLLYTSRCV